MNKHTSGRARIAGQFEDRTFMAVGRECVAKFDHGDSKLPHAKNAAFAALAWNSHAELVRLLKDAGQAIEDITEASEMSVTKLRAEQRALKLGKKIRAFLDTVQS